jgi:DNA-binding NtrC family response regulator
LKAIDRQSFDLVLSDIVMPEMDGIALARAIRARKPDLPVLLITGYSPTATETEFAMLRKPVDLSELSRAIMRLMAEANQSPDSNVVWLRNHRMGPVSQN